MKRPESKEYEHPHMHELPPINSFSSLCEEDRFTRSGARIVQAGGMIHVYEGDRSNSSSRLPPNVSPLFVVRTRFCRIITTAFQCDCPGLSENYATYRTALAVSWRVIVDTHIRATITSMYRISTSPLDLPNEWRLYSFDRVVSVDAGNGLVMLMSKRSMVVLM